MLSISKTISINITVSLYQSISYLFIIAKQFRLMLIFITLAFIETIGLYLALTCYQYVDSFYPKIKSSCCYITSPLLHLPVYSSLNIILVNTSQHNWVYCGMANFIFTSMILCRHRLLLLATSCRGSRIQEIFFQKRSDFNGCITKLD